MRLFIGLWPSPPVLDAVDALPRPDLPAVRWTSREQWHVNLRFLGEVDDAGLPALRESLERRLADLAARSVVLGPAVEWLGSRRRGVLVVPAAGADDLAAAVAQATVGLGQAPDPSPFRGHLTLARVRPGRTSPTGLAGGLIAASWIADRVAVVRSRLHSAGARYDTVAEIPLTRAAADR